MFTIGAGAVTKNLRPGARVAVVGAGPAGLASAISGATAGAEVYVFEKQAVAGRRLLATGGGHCNFTNILDSTAAAKRFGPKERFVSPALKSVDTRQLRHFFEELGVTSVASDGFHVFPESNSAAKVRDALTQACGKLGVRICYGTSVTGLMIEEGRVAGVVAKGLQEKATAVILAAGAASRPELGGDQSGFELARTAGHTIVSPCPALVPLVAREAWPGSLAGITVPMVVVRCDVDGKQATAGKGALLFTHKGISGPAVLDVSGTVASLLQSQGTVKVLIDLAPHMTAEAWCAEFDAAKVEHGTRSILSSLRCRFPAALAKVLLNLAGVSEDTIMARMSGSQRLALITLIMALPVTVSGTEGMRLAMACRGGVAVEEIDRKTCESRLVRGLFFAGEVLDVDGPCGGFNLHWAFASGLIAGDHAARS